MNNKITILVFLFCWLSFSCEKKGFLNEGQVTEEIRPLENFNKIEVYDIFSIYLTMGESSQILIKGGENILPQITAVVKNDTLHIKNNSKQRWSREYNKISLYIPVDPLVSKITLNAPCNMQTLDTIKGDKLTIWAIGELEELNIAINYNFFEFADAHTSTGKFIFAGVANTARVWGRGSCHVIADNLSVDYLHIHSSTIGNCYVHANEVLEYQIDNSGNIYYTGYPESIIELSVTSGGRLIKK